MSGEDQVSEPNTNTSTKTSKFPSLSLFSRGKGKNKGKQKEKEKLQIGEQTNLETSPRQYQRIGIVSLSTEWWQHEQKAFEMGTSYAAGETDYAEILIDENGQRTCLVDLI